MSMTEVFGKIMEMPIKNPLSEISDNSSKTNISSIPQGEEKTMPNSIDWVLDTLKEQDDRIRQAGADGNERDNKNNDSNFEPEQ